MESTAYRRRMGRRALLRGAVGSAAIAATGALLAACGGAEATTTVAPTATRPPAAPTSASGAAGSPAASPTTGASATSGKIPAPAPGVPDAYITLPPPFKSVAAAPGKGGKVSLFLIGYNPPPPPRGENLFWKELEKRLGVELEPTIAPNASYQEKLAATTAGGNLPDLTFISLAAAPDQAKTIQQGAYTDLTPFLTGDALKEFPNLANLPAYVWKSARVNGKLYGVPHPRFLTGGCLMWRQDWAEKVGYAQLKSADDFFACLTAFTKNDPDGNGKADSYGLSSTAPRPMLAMEFIGQIFRVPNGWRQNADGTLTKDIETEEYKQALAFARRLFEAGLYHPDATTMSNTQAKDAFRASKIGSYIDSVTALPGRQNALRFTTKQFTPTANVVGLVPFGYDGGKGVHHTGSGIFGFTTIPAKVGKDKERAKELLRILDWYAAPIGSEESIFINFGIDDVHNTLQPDGTRVINDRGRAERGDLFRVGNGPYDIFYDVPGDAQYIQGFVKDLLAIAIEDPTLTLFSQTDVAKRGELAQLNADRQLAIITGREPLSALDQWIKDWKSRGGDAVRKEFQDAAKGAS